MFKHYFNFIVPSALAKQLSKIKNKKKIHKLVNVIKRELSDLKNEIEKMSADEKEIEKPDKMLKIVEKIRGFNRQQQGYGLKTLTPDQMLSRLPISLAHLNAENNSEKLKNELRQLLYSLYRSKELTKIFIKVWLTLYKNRNNLYEH